MKIVAEFNTYAEMLSFCESILAKERMPFKEDVPQPVKADKPADPEPAEKPEQKTYTKVEVRKVLADLKRAGKDVSSIIHSFGVEMFKELPEEKYGELMEKVREL